MDTYANKLKLKGSRTKDDFLILYKQCKDAKLKERYQALYLSFKYSWEEIAEIVGRDYRTVLEWARAYNREGLEGLLPDRPSGRSSSLTEEQKSQLKETVKQSPRELGYRFSNWTAKRIGGWIANKFRVILSAERIRQILHGIGFSYVKPTYSYIKADKKERKEFLAELNELIGRNELAVFEDESTVDHHPTLHGMWVLKGAKPKVKTFGTHAKRHVFAAVVPSTGEHVSMVAKRLTAKTFVSFLKKMVSRITSPFTLVLDNSPCHKANIVKGFLEEHKGRIRVLWMPKFSPDLNPDEHVWKDMKFNVTHNHMFQTVNRLAWGIRGYFRQLSPEKVRSLCSVDYLFG